MRNPTTRLSLVLLSTLLTACGEGDESAPATAPATPAAVAPKWVSPGEMARAESDAPLVLSVELLGDGQRGTRVRFLVDGTEAGLCDTNVAEDGDCHRGDLFSWTVVLSPGTHLIEALVEGSGIATPVRLARQIEASAVVEAPEAPSDEEPLSPPTQQELGELNLLAGVSRGTLDPDRGFHSVFGGRSWNVRSQRVGLASGSLSGSVTSVGQCMTRYGASIRKWADKYKISRASVVATAITESNCSNPAGSSDGLSSGPMQVTGSTCAAVTGLGRTTCKQRMHSSPDFSFEVGVRYMASSYQRRQHSQDPPKVAAAYNAGSVRSSRANSWHMVVTGNHIDRFVGAYNAYRTWEVTLTGRTTAAKATMVNFDGHAVATEALLPAQGNEGDTIFVGNFAQRDGTFYEYRGNAFVRADRD